jgi:hypothetical protein
VRGEEAQFNRRIEGQQRCRRVGSACLVFTRGWSKRRGPRLLRHLVFSQTAQSLGMFVLCTTLGQGVYRLLCVTSIYKAFAQFAAASPHLLAVLDLGSI